MKKKLNIMIVTAAAVVLGGCATGGGKGPQAEQTLAVSPHPATGYAYPLESPTAEEQAGMVLRYSFSKALHYREDEIADGNPKSGRKVKIQKKTDFTYLPTEKPDVFVIKSSAAASAARECNNRGCELRVIRSSPNANNLETTVEDTGEFPEAGVKIGDSWERHFLSKSTANNYSRDVEATTKCTLVGFTTVRSHRCAVVEGSEQMKNNAETTEKKRSVERAIERTARQVTYFDYHLGTIVERVLIFDGESRTSTTGSKRNSDVIVVGQNILTLLE